MNASFVHFSRQTLIGGISTVLGYARWLLVMPLLTRGFGTEGYGIWVQLIIGADLLAGVTGLGLNFALLRYVPTRSNPREAAADLWSSMLVCWAMSLPLIGIGLVADEWLAHTFLGGATQAFAVRLALVLIPISGSLNLVLSYLRGAGQAAAHTSLVALETGGWLALAATVFYLGGELRAMIVGLLAVKALTLAGGTIFVLWRSGISYPPIAKITTCLRYGLPLLPLGLLQWVINASDRYFLAYFCEPEIVGIYSVSYSLGSIAGLAYAPIFFGLVPATSAAWNAGRSAEVLEYLRFAQKYPFLLVVPGILLLTGYANQTVGIVATNQFAATPALITCVAMAIVIMNIGAIAQTILNVADFTQRILAISIAAALFNLAANTIAVPSYGATGAAVATLSTYIFYAALTHMMSRSILPFPWAWHHMAKVLLAAVPLLLALSFSSKQLSLQILTTIGSCIAYVGILIASGIFEPREWQLTRAMLSLGQKEP